MKLHLGCLDHVVDGWVNTDITPHIFIARVPGLAFLLHRVGAMNRARYLQHKSRIFRSVDYLNASKPFRLPSESVDFVYTSHMLEHLPPADGLNCLRECRRVLKPGGVLRIAVPDLDKLVAAYDSSEPEPFLYAIFEANQTRSKNRHSWHYSSHSMERLTRECGFSGGATREFQLGRCPDLETLETRQESLFFEAWK